MAKRIKAPEWKPADYTPFYLQDFPTHTEKEIRAEYTRIRDIVQKRAKRLEAGSLEGPAAFLRKAWTGRFSASNRSFLNSAM